MNTDWAWTDRFWAKVEEDPATGCWLWRASLASGYGRYTTRHYPRSGSAHRIAYELVIGLIPEGLTLHYRCRVPACVNPAHLEPMRMGENALLGGGPAALNARKTHCHRGHPLSGENLKVRPGEGPSLSYLLSRAQAGVHAAMEPDEEGSCQGDRSRRASSWRLGPGRDV